MPEIQIVLWAVGIILAADFIAMLLFVLYAKLPDSRLKRQIMLIIYELDRFADSMSNEQKRSRAISDIGGILGWRRILIPSVLIGLIIDMQVAAIRKMQKATKTPDLHREE